MQYVALSMNADNNGYVISTPCNYQQAKEQAACGHPRGYTGKVMAVAVAKSYKGGVLAGLSDAIAKGQSLS